MMDDNNNPEHISGTDEFTLADLSDAMVFFIAVLIKHSCINPDIIERDFLFSLIHLRDGGNGADPTLRLNNIDEILRLKDKITGIYEVIKDE